MRRRVVFPVAVGVIAVILLGIVGCAQLGGARPGIVAGERIFYVTGLEYKGSTSTKDLANPEIDPKTLGDGYRYKKPGDADKGDATKWEVSTYRWEPGMMTAFQGDKVSVVGFITNGDKHKTWIADPQGNAVMKEQEWQRGREYKVSFVADQPGYYVLHCDEHDPSMTAYIVVLPK